MAGWKLRKDKAPAETLDPALASDPEAAAPPEVPTAAETQAALSEHEPISHEHEPILLDSLPSLPSFAAEPVDAEAHFTDLDFDTDAEEQTAERSADGPLTLVDYTEAGTPDAYVFDAPSTIVTLPPNAAMKPKDVAPTPKDYEAPAAETPLPAYEVPSVVLSEPEPVYNAPAPVYEMPPPGYTTPATDDPSPDEFDPNVFEYVSHATSYEEPGAAIAMPPPGSDAPVHSGYDFSPPDFGASDFSTPDFSTPAVAPFVLDLPPAQTPATTPQLVVRIGRLSAPFDLTKEVTSIGRPDSALHYYPDVEIEMDDAVSRRHAEIVRRDGYFYLVDTGSTNGTLLNGEMLPPHDERLLAPGDHIRVGDRTEITFGP